MLVCKKCGKAITGDDATAKQSRFTWYFMHTCKDCFMQGVALDDSAYQTREAKHEAEYHAREAKHEADRHEREALHEEIYQARQLKHEELKPETPPDKTEE